MDQQDNPRVVADEVIGGIRWPGRYDAPVASEGEAVRLAKLALPGAVELPRALRGVAYPPPPAGAKTWIQSQPAEPEVGNDLPHVKYADWSTGKKGRELGAPVLPAGSGVC